MHTEINQPMLTWTNLQVEDVQRVLECLDIDKDKVRSLSPVWGYVCKYNLYLNMFKECWSVYKDNVRLLSRVWEYVYMYVCMHVFVHVQRVLECLEIDKDKVRLLSRVGICIHVCMYLHM